MFKWKSRYGEFLTGIEGFYLDKKSCVTNPINLNLVFSGGIIGIGLNGNGEGVSVSSHPCKEVDLGEYGKVTKRNISDVGDFGSLIGGFLESCGMVVSKAHGDELGLQIVLNTGRLFILNVGDEMFVGRHMPEIE